jgi:uncharacterized membrane protein
MSEVSLLIFGVFLTWRRFSACRAGLVWGLAFAALMCDASAKSDVAE